MTTSLTRLSLFLLGCSLVHSTAAGGASIRGVGLISTESPTATPPPPGTLAAVAAGDSDLSILVDLVTFAGLGDLLTSEGPFTVFAPTNDAFAEVIPDPKNLDVLDPAVVNSLLAYHVVPVTVMASDITDGLVLETAEGGTIKFGVTDGGATVNDEVISATDIAASNGIVHKIDGVMFPQSILGPQTDPPEVPVVPEATDAPEVPDAPEEPPAEELAVTLAGLAASDPDLSILLELVTIAGLGDLLNSPGPFTVFAPTNAAFIEVITDPDNLEALDVGIVTTLLAYHVVPGVVMAGDIADGLILDTAVEGETIEFHVTADGATVNEEVISATDIVASNGVVHKIDGVMFPQSLIVPTEEPAPIEESVLSLAEIASSDPDLSILLELVNIAGLGGLLGSPGQYTVFAPTNAAWLEVIEDPDNLEALDIGIVTTLLAYHVVPATIMASDIFDGLILGTGVTGETVEFHVTADGITVNEEVISGADIVASNGIVHKIDGVMFPQQFVAAAAEGRMEGFTRGFTRRRLLSKFA